MYWAAKVRRALGREPDAALPRSFAGDAGRARAKDVLLNNPAVGNEESVANDLLSKGEFAFYRKGNRLIKEGDHDNDVFFLLAGDVDVVFGTRLGSIRSSPNQVGEMAATDPGQKRTANVFARSDEVAVLRVSGNDFYTIHNGSAGFRCRLQREMSTRHRERINAGKVAKQNNSLFWFMISFGVGLTSGAVSWFVLPNGWTALAQSVAAAGIGLFLFIFTLLHNPAFFWRRCAGLSLLAMLGLLMLDRFLTFRIEQGFGSLSVRFAGSGEPANWKVALGLLVAMAICAYKDRSSG